MLYVHIPYCHHKCTYCGFYSVAGRRNPQAYVDALCKELAMRADGHQLRTIYFGGGTPTVLSLRQLRQIVEVIRDSFDLCGLEEATIEANPENLSLEYLDGLRDIQLFNRLSIGIQSFRDDELRLLNRVHNSSQARESIVNAARSGFDNVSVDLIMGLPGQTVEDWRYNLDALTEILDNNVVRHLSCYELTLEPGSILERQIQLGRVMMSDDETLVAQYELLLEWCAANGFEQYEVSNFCRQGYRSRHNSRYWDRTPYIGVGAAAHSFDGKTRRWNLPDIERYVAGCAEGLIPFEEEVLTNDDAFNEYIMTALRTTEGVDKSKVAEEYRAMVDEHIQVFVQKGLIVDTQTHFCPTKSGLMHADGIASHLFV